MQFADTEIKNDYTNTNQLFPIFLKLSKLRTLIVGGGTVGLEKLNAVISNSPSADITVVAPVIKDEIKLLAMEYENINLINRVFLAEDIEGKDILIAATNDKELNRVIKEEARARKILINVADTPELCDFYLGSIVKKGSIKIAISTNGKSPTIAKRLREIFEKGLPDELEESLNNLVKIRSSLNGNFARKVKELNKITSVLAEEKKKSNKYKIFKGILISLLLMTGGHLILNNISFDFIKEAVKQIYLGADPNFPWFVIAGFIAQMIDGAVGMAYGLSATTFLLALGLPPANVSASVHTSEIFTSGASGLMHLKLGNVNNRLFKKLLLPGVIGSVTGALLLSLLSEYNFIIKPVIAAYTLILGVIIICKAIRKKKEIRDIKFISPLAGVGGFLDAAGGGGWGPIVASTLIAKGKHPLTTIGSVNLAEFFVAAASSAAFITVIGLTHWQVIIGLIAGGVLAAPLAAKAAGRLPVRTLMILVGILVIIVSLKIISEII